MKARERLFAIWINSLSLFLISYLLVYLFNQLITLGVAQLLGIGGSLRYFEIIYSIPNNSTYWTIARVIAVSVTAPVISLLLSVVLLYGVIYETERSGYWKFFFLWLGLHFMNAFFGGIIAGCVTGRGIGYPLDYALWPHYNVYLWISLASASFMALFGYMKASDIFKISPSRFWVKRKRRKQFVVFSLLLPWFVGSTIFFILKFPNSTPQHQNIFIHDVVLLFSMCFLLVPMLFYSKTVRQPAEEPIPHEKHNYVLLPFITIVLIVAYRLLFA